MTQYYPPEVGAPQLRLSAFAREARSLGHEVDVITALPNYPNGKIQVGYRNRLWVRETRDGVRILHLPVFPAIGGGFKRLLNYGSFSISALGGVALVRRPDVLFVESPPLTIGPTAWLASKMWRRPFVFNVADLWPDSIRELGVFENERILRALERLEAWTYSKASVVVAVTEGIRRRLTESKRLPPSKVLFFPNGADIELFQPGDRCAARTKFGFGLGPVIAYAGTIGLAQGLDVAVRAMETVRLRHPDALLCLAGSGAEVERLKQLAEGNAGSVRFLGTIPVEEVAQLYQAADIGIVTLKDLPLLEGARPSKMLPMMAAGLPVVFSGRGEGPALLAEAGGGCSVVPEDPAALAAALSSLIDDPILRARFGQLGRSFVVANYSWSTLVQRFLDELGAILPSDGGPRRSSGLRLGTGRANT